MAVTEHLHLDVASVHEQLLDVERGVPERGVGLPRRLRASTSASSSGPVATRIPRPPPPAAALTITG